MDPEMFSEDNFTDKERANELLNTIDNIEQEKKEKKKKQETTMKKSSSSSSNGKYSSDSNNNPKGKLK